MNVIVKNGIICFVRSQTATLFVEHDLPHYINCHKNIHFFLPHNYTARNVA